MKHRNGCLRERIKALQQTSRATFHFSSTHFQTLKIQELFSSHLRRRGGHNAQLTLTWTTKKILLLKEQISQVHEHLCPEISVIKMIIIIIINIIIVIIITNTITMITAGNYYYFFAIF